MTRIVAGSRGGRRLEAPPGQGTRPTSDRVREALFSSLDAFLDIEGCQFADLYAGSGAVGLEAASRGAAGVLLVESDPRAAKVIRANIAALELAVVCRLRAVSVLTALATPPDQPYDVVFADPPYSVGEAELAAMFTALGQPGWLAPDAWVVLERSTRSPEPQWPEYLTSHRARRYGESMLWYVRPA
jgi:16S rRNA (guanine(966)-N(2))-methyltransferase RsmD